jgi:hypothetical protein
LKKKRLVRCLTGIFASLLKKSLKNSGKNTIRRKNQKLFNKKSKLQCIIFRKNWFKICFADFSYEPQCSLGVINTILRPKYAVLHRESFIQYLEFPSRLYNSTWFCPNSGRILSRGKTLGFKSRRVLDSSRWTNFVYVWRCCERLWRQVLPVAKGGGVRNCSFYTGRYCLMGGAACLAQRNPSNVL